MQRTIRLYRHVLSGHSHRVQLMLSLLGLPHELIDVDLLGGEHKRAPFLAKNAFGQVPVIEDGELTIADSTAILVYLALRYDPTRRFLPQDPYRAALVQRWLSVASGALYIGPNRLRLAALLGAAVERASAEAVTSQLLAILERDLSDRPYLVGTEPTLADVAIYTYVAVAPEGGVALEPYPHLRAWLARIEALDGFVAMPPAAKGS